MNKTKVIDLDVSDIEEDSEDELIAELEKDEQINHKNFINDSHLSESDYEPSDESEIEQDLSDLQKQVEFFKKEVAQFKAMVAIAQQLTEENKKSIEYVQEQIKIINNKK